MLENEKTPEIMQKLTTPEQKPLLSEESMEKSFMGLHQARLLRAVLS